MKKLNLKRENEARTWAMVSKQEIAQTGLFEKSKEKAIWEKDVDREGLELAVGQLTEKADKGI